ncbi:MAG: hypothetical protein H7231_07560, partial [Rhodoferax sp.]|nr:hypothetical protein [Actinomycetota bacterium]
AQDKQQAARLGYGIVGHEVRDGEDIESWGRVGLGSTLERSERAGWVLVSRDGSGRRTAGPLEVGVPQDAIDDVVWALIEQDRARHHRWAPGRDEDARFTAVCAEATATLHPIDDDWCLCTAWSDDSADVAALTDAWSAPSAAEAGARVALGPARGGRITGR